MLRSGWPGEETIWRRHGWLFKPVPLPAQQPSFSSRAAEKYLKGYLLCKGWRLKKTHDLRELVARASEHDASFGGYLDMARSLTAYYLEDRYPPGPPPDYPREEVADIMKQTEELISAIGKALE